MKIRYLVNLFTCFLIILLSIGVLISCDLNPSLEEDPVDPGADEAEILLGELAPSLDDINAELIDIAGVVVGNTTTYNNVPTESGTKTIAITNNPDGSRTVVTTIIGAIEFIEGIDPDGGILTLEVTIDVNISTTYNADGSISVSGTVTETLVDGMTYILESAYNFSISADGLTLTGDVTVSEWEDTILKTEELIEINTYLDELTSEPGGIEDIKKNEEAVLYSMLTVQQVFFENYSPDDLVDGILREHAGPNFTITAIMDLDTLEVIWTYSFTNYEIVMDASYIINSPSGEVISYSELTYICSGIVEVDGVEITINVSIEPDPPTSVEIVYSAIDYARDAFMIDDPTALDAGIPVTFTSITPGFSVTASRDLVTLSEHWEITFLNFDLDGTYVLNSSVGQIVYVDIIIEGLNAISTETGSVTVTIDNIEEIITLL